jgi:hypothetical protein
LYEQKLKQNKMKKIIFTVLVCITFTVSGFAQSDKMKEKATAKVEKINTSIVKGDKNLALTEEQRTGIYELQIESLKAIKKIRKEEYGKKKQKTLIKAEHKRVGAYISQNILTKEQKKARKEARAKNKKE